MLACLICALLNLNVNYIISLVGAVIGFMLIYILPAKIFVESVKLGAVDCYSELAASAKSEYAPRRTLEVWENILIILVILFGLSIGVLSLLAIFGIDL